MISFMICIDHEILLAGQVMRDVVGGAYGNCWGGERTYRNFYGDLR